MSAKGFARSSALALSTALVLAACGGGGGDSAPTTINNGSSGSAPQSSAGAWSGSYVSGATTEHATLVMTTGGVGYALVFAASGSLDLIVASPVPPTAQPTNPNYKTSSQGMIYKNVGNGVLQRVAATMGEVTAITEKTSFAATIKGFNWADGAAQPAMTGTSDSTSSLTMQFDATNNKAATAAALVGNYLTALNSLGQMDSVFTSMSIDSSGQLSASLSNGCAFNASTDADPGQLGSNYVSLLGSMSGVSCAEAGRSYSGTISLIYGTDGKVSGMTMLIRDADTVSKGYFYQGGRTSS
jgi:hypothetical protein